jgi:hypothetical protein
LGGGVVGSLLGLGVVLPILGELYLAFDDIYALLTGADSVTGNWLTTLYGAGGAKTRIDALKDAFFGVVGAVLGANTTAETFKQDLADLAADNVPTFARVAIKSFAAVAGAIDLVATGVRTLWDLISGIASGIAYILSFGQWTSAGNYAAGQFGDTITANEQWEKRQKALSKLYDAADAAFPDMPRGTTKAMRQNEQAATAGGYEDTASGVSRPVNSSGALPWAITPSGPVQVTDNRQTHVTVSVTGAPNASPDALANTVADKVMSRIQDRDNATYNQVSSSQPDQLFSPQ